MGYQTRYSGGVSLGLIWPGIPAHTANPVAWSAATALNASNDTVYCRVLAGFSASATSVRLHLGASSGNICVAVYADNGSGLPGTRLSTTGSIASPGIGFRTVTLGTAVDVTPGMWISISADNTTVTFSRGGSAGGSTSGFGAAFQAVETSAFPAPATANAAAGWRSEFILVAV